MYLLCRSNAYTIITLTNITYNIATSHKRPQWSHLTVHKMKLFNKVIDTRSINNTQNLHLSNNDNIYTLSVVYFIHVDSMPKF